MLETNMNGTVSETEWYYLYRDWLKNDYHYELQMDDRQICVGANHRSLFEFRKREGYYKKADSLAEVDLDETIQEFKQIQKGS